MQVIRLAYSGAEALVPPTIAKLPAGYHEIAGIRVGIGRNIRDRTSGKMSRIDPPRHLALLVIWHRDNVADPQAAPPARRSTPPL